MLRFSFRCLRPHLRTSFHHQPEAQHPKYSAIHKNAGRLPHLLTQSGHLPRQPRVTGPWEIDGRSASLRLDVEAPNEVAPLLRFVADELAEISRRKRERVATQIGKPRLVLWIGEASVDLLVKFVDDLGGRGLRCADAVPAARLITW